MTKIIDLKNGDLHININVNVVSIGEVKEFEKAGRAGRVCEAVVEDESGQIKMSVWNNDIDKIRVGDVIQINNGYVNEYKNEPRLSTGKFGTLEVLESAKLEDSIKKSETAEEVKPKVKKDGKRSSRKKAKKL